MDWTCAGQPFCLLIVFELFRLVDLEILSRSLPNLSMFFES